MSTNTMNANSVALTAQGVIGTTKVATSLVGKTQLRFTLATVPPEEGEDAEDVEDVHIKPAVWNPIDPAVEVAKATFSSKNWGDTRDAFWGYYNRLSTQIVGLRLESNDVENFDGEFTFTKCDPTGKKSDMSFSLSEYKVESSKSSGFSNSLVIPANKLSFVLSAALDWKLSKLKAGSKIDFIIDISGEEKVSELSTITSTILE